MRDDAGGRTRGRRRQRADRRAEKREEREERRARRGRRPGGLVLLLVLLAAFSGGVTYGVYRVLAGPAVREYDLLAERGVRVTGTVVAASPRERLVPFVGSDGTVVYRFSAGALVFEGRGGSAPPNPRAALLSPGEAVTVVYDGSEPTRSCLCDPVDRGRRTRTAMVVAAGATACVVPLVGGLAAAAVGRRRRDEDL